MPLFFAIAGLVSALLALLVLGAPVLLVVLVIKGVLTARRSRRGAGDVEGQALSLPSDPPSTDELFADLIGHQWPVETAGLRDPTQARSEFGSFELGRPE